MATKTGAYASPEGPYTSPWASPHYLIRTLYDGGPVYKVLPNGVQAHEATLVFASLREAREWLATNGFEYQGRP